MSRPPEPQRSQSTTSLSRLYNGSAPNGQPNGDEELNDPKLDFCNSFWGQGDRGFEVVMARLRGAGRTIDELKAFWKERAAIEEDYAKRLAKLARFSLGRDEVGVLAESLQNLLSETAQQSSYHASLGTEIKQTVEQPTAEFAARLSNLKKGLQTSVEKSYKNKGLQEGHVQKARERYEQDCLKLNSYTAQSSMTQGKELDKVQTKLERVRQTIGGNEQEFRQFVRLLEGTSAKWESEWKGFCDHVQDLEEDRLALTKDLIWVYANAVSQVCVEDDSSCERVREKLEQFEPQNDMVNFVRGWGTGDMIPDAPRFINYNAGESYPTQPTFHVAHFNRISSRPPGPPMQQSLGEQSDAPEDAPLADEHASQPNGHGSSADGIANDLQRTALRDEPPAVPAETEKPATKPPFGGVALPGLASAASPPPQNTSSYGSMPPPPLPPTMSMPEPRIPSRQGPPSPRDVNNEEDPMAKALADLRREPPPPGSVRRNTSHRRPESVVSHTGSVRGSQYGHGIKSPASPAPSNNRMSYQPPVQNMPGTPSRTSIDMTLSPPPGGHTAAALAKSMDEFRQQSSRGPESKRQSVNYANYADDIVGAHPVSRPSTPSGGGRAPSPAMMQPPRQPPSPIADEVISGYGQAFPGERREEARSRSRAGSMISNASRPGSYIGQPPQSQQPPASPREGFVGIGAGGGRSPSPQPPVFRSPSPSPVMAQGSLGPQNLGIALDAKGAVAQDSMAEAYRRQYQQQQQAQQPQQQQAPPPQNMSTYPGKRSSQYGSQQTQSQPQSGYGGISQQQQQFGNQRQSAYGSQQGHSPIPASSPNVGGPPSISNNRPLSNYGLPQQTQPQPQQQAGYGQARPTSGYGQQPAHQASYQQNNQPPPQQQQPSYGGYGQQQPPQPNYQQHPVSPSAGPGYQNGYANPQQQQPQYGASQGQSQFQPIQNRYARSASPAPQPQQQQQQQQQYGYRAPSPQPQAQAQSGYTSYANRSPSPQPNQPPSNVTPTGQWSTTGLPVLFYVKALYDYVAESAAEFDFQAGDIIAVTATPEDGWWSGELLDEARRIPGRTDFPSNFVCLF